MGIGHQSELGEQQIEKQEAKPLKQVWPTYVYEPTIPLPFCPCNQKHKCMGNYYENMVQKCILSEKIYTGTND